AGKIDQSFRRVIGKKLALVFRQNLVIDDGRNPVGQMRINDAVGDQLRGEVVVVSAGEESLAQQREVAIGATGIEDEFRVEVLGVCSGIETDTACERGGTTSRRHCGGDSLFGRNTGG